MHKHLTANVFVAAAFLASQGAWALGFGRVVPDAVLGRPLVFTASVHVDDGEQFGYECVAAEVYFGDSRVAPDDIRVSAQRAATDNDWTVRVTTLVPIGEPIHSETGRRAQSR